VDFCIRSAKACALFLHETYAHAPSIQDNIVLWGLIYNVDLVYPDDAGIGMVVAR